MGRAPGAGGARAGRCIVGLVRTAKYALVALALGACGQPPGAKAPRAEQALTANGVPQNGFPSWAERTVLVLTNRARADPQAALTCSSAECPDKPCYGPVPPLLWNYDLNRSSRFHVTNLVDASSGLQHPSPCTLDTHIGSTYPSTCDGSQACACASNACTSACNCPQGTDPFVRIGYFFPSTQSQYACAENVAAGYGDPMQVMDGWLDESCVNSPYTCETADCTQNESHRANILNGGNTWMGSGEVVADASACYPGGWWAQDFGCNLGAPPTYPKLVAGSHFPQASSAPTFYANWYASGAPASAQVDVDGTCHAMGVDRGSGGNATYAYAATGLAGCHRYAFTFSDAQGAYTVPASGAYLAGTSCTADWDAPAPAPCGAPATGSTSSASSASSGSGSTASSSSSSGSNGSASTTGGSSTAGSSASSSSGSGSASSGTGTTGTPSSAAATTSASGGSGVSANDGSGATVDGGCGSAGGPGVLAFAPLLAFALRRRGRV